ncbi:MAG TPA: PilZ domain-containing protein [Kofleriaceae bacterium]|nr:PilZ domain-containing protein [Kofleriaceae bacterium]
MVAGDNALADNRRTSTRHAVSINAKLVVDGNSKPCTVLNLSLGGALVSAGTRFAMGQRLQIAFPVPTMEEAIEVGATVRWSDDKATGLQFDGLRARDVWALNKYFEQLPQV